MGIRTYPDRARIYCDMDGVIADFDRAMRETGKTAKEIKCLQHTYRNLHPVPGAIEAIRSLLADKWQFFVLTKPPAENPHCASEKIHWLNEHLPEVGENIIITPDKGCVGTRLDYLIDDHPEWANASKFPGMIVKFGALQNETIGQKHLHAARNWEEVLKKFKDFKELSTILGGHKEWV